MGDAEAIYSHFRITIALNPVVCIARILNPTRILIVTVDFIGNKKKKMNETQSCWYFSPGDKKTLFFWYQTLFCSKQHELYTHTLYKPTVIAYESSVNRGRRFVENIHNSKHVRSSAAL